MQPIGVAAIVLAVSTVISLPAALLTLPGSAPGIGPLAAVAALGIVGTGVAFAIFYELIAEVGPARTFLVTYLAPIFAVAYGVVLLDEPFGAASLCGLLLILIGSYLAAGGNPREGRQPGLRSGARAFRGTRSPRSSVFIASASSARAVSRARA